jgi:hypothetical protein
MILFERDWIDKHPEAIVDYQTSNKSFLRISALYREVGIRNHTFMLSLLNPELQGVDPFASDLTRDQMLAIAVECKLNFWYYVREIASAPNVAGNERIPIKANRGNIAIWWLFLNHITCLLVQPRQSGKSVTMGVLSSWLMGIRCSNTTINLLTLDDTLRGKSLGDLKDIMSKLPAYINLRKKNDVGNTETLEVRRLKNKFIGHLPNKSIKLANNVGRGFTSPVALIDEAGMDYNIEVSLPVILSTGTAARDIAARAMEPYGTILATTAGKKDEREGRYMYNFMMDMAVWTEKLFDAPDAATLEKIIRKASPKHELFVNCTFSHRQLGYTDLWLKNVLEQTRSMGDAADRDYFNIWTSGSISHPLGQEVLDKVRASIKEDYYSEISPVHGYITRWYLPEPVIAHALATQHFIMAVDSSDAIGRDDIAMTLRDVRTGGLVAAGNYNETNLYTFSEWLADWLVKYPTITLVVERRSSGMAIIDNLIVILLSKGIDPFKRLFNTVVNDSDAYPDRFKEIEKPLYARDPEIYARYKRHFGFATSSSGTHSRAELYGITLTNAAKYTGHMVRDNTTALQILGLVVKNGRVDHADGEHDDSVISWLLSYWVLAHGKNLGHYGINGQEIMAANEAVRSVVQHQNSYDYVAQQGLRKEIEELYEKICKERDSFLVEKLERQLRVLSSRLVLQEGEVFSLEELLANAARTRRMSVVMNRSSSQFQPHYGVGQPPSGQYNTYRGYGGSRGGYTGTYGGR